MKLKKRSKSPTYVAIQQEAYICGDNRSYGAIAINAEWFTSMTPRCSADAVSINSAMEEIVQAFKK